jgi:histone deacetylase 1/2
MLVGGGGYTLRNVPRCWTYETSLCLNLNISNQMPDNLYNEYFAPEYKLHLPISNMENQNCKPYL